MSSVKVRAYYRVSDQSYEKPKLPGSDKRSCFESFLGGFGELGRDLTVIADRASLETVRLFEGTRVVRTDLGNAGSLRYTIEMALEESDSDTFVYFAEDDYVYRPGSINVLREGASISDYVTLYDHPDKYTKQYLMGETSQVRRTSSSHWRYTLSTCMTFGVWQDILKNDMYFWGDHTKGDHPNDHQVFADLNGSGRRLAVPIPGWACHTDLTFSGVVNELLIDDWAIDQMIGVLDSRTIGDEQFGMLKDMALAKVPGGWNRLKMLDALHQMSGNTNSQD